MARPAEKARAMLNKWTAMREAEIGGPSSSNRRGGPRGRRPHLASECEHLADAERFRGQIVREIANKVEQIQNPALGEHKLRELNDEINQLHREKYHWNKRIYQLGGLEYNSIERQRQIEEGGDDQLGIGYKYFGAAKDLPGVKEFLHQQALQRAKQLQHGKGGGVERYKHITPDYFGWRDEEDGVLLELEARADDINNPLVKRRKTSEDDDSFVVDVDYLAVPSQQEIEQHLLELKKKSLLAKYAL